MARPAFTGSDIGLTAVKGRTPRDARIPSRKQRLAQSRLHPAGPMIVSAALATLLAGCLSAPTPSNTTTSWTPPRRAQQSDTTWKSVREQESDFSQPLALADLADISLRNNPATRKAWNDARAAAAQVAQARGYFLPTIVGTGAGTRQGVSANPDSFNMDYLEYGPGVQLNYLIFNFGGGRSAAVEQALQTVYALDYTFNRSIQDVLLALETAYYNLLAAEAGVEAALAVVKDAKLVLDTAQERASAGVGIVLDVLQAQSSYDQALYGLANVKGLLKIARGNLARAMGFPADKAIMVKPPPVDVPEALTTQDVQVLIDDALNRRPDIAALRATLAAKKAAVTVAGSTLWPSLYLDGALNRNYYENYSSKDLQDNDWSYNAGLSLKWTLFDGLQTLSAKRAAAAQAESVKAQLAQAELAASAEVWTSYASYETALEKCRFSSAYLKSTSAAYDLAMDSYRSGLKTMLDVINAESELAQARKQYITSRQDAFIALANLAYATGLLEKGGSGRTQEFFSTNAKKDH